MLPSHSAEQVAIASLLVTELAEYEQGLRRLVLDWDADLYRSLSDQYQFDRMQMYAAALPSLSVSWTELLISRAELMHAIWTGRVPPHANGKAIALQAQHHAMVAEVLRKCVAYISRPQ
jgi:hypothetical protein